MHTQHLSIMGRSARRTENSSVATLRRPLRLLSHVGPRQVRASHAC